MKFLRISTTDNESDEYRRLTLHTGETFTVGIISRSTEMIHAYELTFDPEGRLLPRPDVDTQHLIKPADVASEEPFTFNAADAPEHRKYVVGFLFGANAQNVLLILKKRPAWQFGFLNGPGGKIEAGDANPRAAMEREFFEEVGISDVYWQEFAILNGRFGGDAAAPPYTVHFFIGFGNVHRARRKTNETPIIFPVGQLQQRRKELIANLTWMIPMGLEWYENYGDIKGCKPYVITEPSMVNMTWKEDQGLEGQPTPAQTP